MREAHALGATMKIASDGFATMARGILLEQVQRA
jgi:hypothetical protein